MCISAIGLVWRVRPTLALYRKLYVLGELVADSCGGWHGVQRVCCPLRKPCLTNPSSSCHPCLLDGSTLTTRIKEDTSTSRACSALCVDATFLRILDPLIMQSLYTSPFRQRCAFQRSDWSGVFVRPSRANENYTFWETWSLTRAVAGKEYVACAAHRGSLA